MTGELWLPLVVALVGLSGVLITWAANEWAKRHQLNFRSKERRYLALIRSLEGFYQDSVNKELKSEFLRQLDLAWLYCPDQVIKQAYVFLAHVHEDIKATELEKKKALGEFYLAVRKDLLGSTTLTAMDYKLFKST